MANSIAYRLCFFNGSQISSITRINCQSDGEARDLASKVRLVTSVEVWFGNRRICQMPAAVTEIPDGEDSEQAPASENRTTSQHVRTRQLLLSRHRSGDRQMIEESKLALVDSRRLLNRRFVSQS